MSSIPKKKRIVELTNEYSRDARKPYAMCHQINWNVDDISRGQIDFDIKLGSDRKEEIYTRKEGRLQLVYNIRNAMLIYLGDLVPCPNFSAVLSHPNIKLLQERFKGPFYNPHQEEFSYENSACR